MQKKLLTNGNTFKRTDGRWNGVVWYMDEQGQRKRKSFSGTSKQEAREKITAYIATFNQQLTASDESKARLEDSMGHWLKVFKFPSVERGTYDRLECTAKHQIYPLIGGKIVGDVTPSDIKMVLNHWMNEGYAYTTVKKVHNLLTDYFRYLAQQELIPQNPMLAAPMIKKANFMASQGNQCVTPWAKMGGIPLPEGEGNRFNPQRHNRRMNRRNEASAGRRSCTALRAEIGAKPKDEKNSRIKAWRRKRPQAKPLLPAVRAVDGSFPGIKSGVCLGQENEVWRLTFDFYYYSNGFGWGHKLLYGEIPDFKG